MSAAGRDEGAPALARLPEARFERPLAGVLLVHGAGGLAEHARACAERLAAEGFAVLAPDLLRGAPADALDDRAALAQLEAALARLQDDAEVDAQRTAVVGLDAGGTLAFQLACATRRPLAAAVDLGGPLVHAALSARRPIQPLELALNLGAPLLVLLGCDDPELPAGHAERVRTTLAQFARDADVRVLPGAGARFLDPASPGYHGAAAREAWSRTLDFLRQALA